MESSLDLVVDQVVQDTAEQWVEEEVRGVADATTEFASSQGGLLKEVSSIVDKYASDEVKRDIPTGIQSSWPCCAD